MIKNLALCLLITLSFSAFAQKNTNSENKGFYYFVGTNAINKSISKPLLLFTEFSKVDYDGLPVTLGLNYRFTDRFALASTISSNKILTDGGNYDYLALDVNSRIYLDGVFNKFLGINKKFEFYGEAGLGLYLFDNTNNYTSNFNFGVDYKLNNTLSLSFKGATKTTLGEVSDKLDRGHIIYMLGLTVRAKIDRDFDGVEDKKDVCPDIPGLKEFSGCPDLDGDGIPDNKDACPQFKGSESNNGCPDTDADGIIDRDDSCPKIAGSPEMNGCPDTDGDSVADNLDKCPNTSGDPSNNGCPWPDSDNDGVFDKDDACPNEAGVAENNGCPAEPTELIEFVNSSDATIVFKVDSSKINQNGNNALDKLVALMAQYPKARIIIEGHASSDGSSSYNQKLSDKRSQSLMLYLTEAGVANSRIETVGYGEDKPIEDNATYQGRKANRRAVIKRIE